MKNNYYGLTFDEFRKGNAFLKRNLVDTYNEYFIDEGFKKIEGKEFEELKNKYPFLKNAIHIFKGKHPHSGITVFAWVGKRGGKGFSFGDIPFDSLPVHVDYNPFSNYYNWIEKKYPEADKLMVAKGLNNPHSVFTDEELKIKRKKYGKEFVNGNLHRKESQ